MKTNLRHGKLPPPESLSAAKARRKQLLSEIPKVEAQIADATLPLRHESMAAYDEWLGSARRALALYVEETRLLRLWIEDRETGDGLLRETYELMKKLELRLNFTDEESHLMERLDEFFEAREAKKAAG